MLRMLLEIAARAAEDAQRVALAPEVTRREQRWGLLCMQLLEGLMRRG